MARCGTSRAYKLGCRCDTCRLEKNRQAREYAARVKAREGIHPSQRYKPPPRTQPCAWCGDPLFRPQREDAMHKTCRAESRQPRYTALPADHPAHWVGDSSPVAYRDCGWCGRVFVAHGDTHAYCNDDCKVRAKRCRRKATEAGTYGYWSWADFMRVAQRFGFCCAYCGDKPERLDPDHVVPLSRGGPNVLANLLPACLRCNSDKRDLLLPEWALDRERRMLPPRATSWGAEDKRYWHLTYLAVAA